MEQTPQTENKENKSSNLKKIGGLYKRESKRDGKKYLGGVLILDDDLGNRSYREVSVFPNRWKEKESDFDYLIYDGGERKVKNKPLPPKVEEKVEEKPVETDKPPF